MTVLQSLEKSLSYDDIRFYRSIARSQARKDIAARRQLEEDKKKEQPQSSGSWTGWLWGSSSSEAPAEEPAFSGEMTDEQRKQLYEVLDYDERAAVAESFQTPRDALKLRVTSKLNKGSFGLRRDSRDSGSEVLSLVFDVFRANFIQRPDSFDASVSLGGFEVYDGTTKSTIYPQIVHVKESQRNEGTGNMPRKGTLESEDPFFYLKFESNPLDNRADNALTVRMRHMEVIYHKGYVEAVQKFFKPPDSQLESVEALLVSATLHSSIPMLMVTIGCCEPNTRWNPERNTSWP
jgi:vacuolar protein sorting-associated protein 13A/C